MKKKTFAVDIDGTITENGGGRIHLDALEALRRLTNMGHDVIYVTGRSSVEAYLLSVFGGTKKIAVGENGGCIAMDTDDTILLGDIDECNRAFELIKNNIEGVQKKHVFPRLTEVVLERTFDMDAARKILTAKFTELIFESSNKRINFFIGNTDGFTEIMKKFNILKDDVIAIGDSATDVPLFKVAKTSIALGNASDAVRSEATMTVSGCSGDGVLEALDKLAPKLSEI